jgi:hypothetical protein
MWYVRKTPKDGPKVGADSLLAVFAMEVSILFFALSE